MVLGLTGKYCAGKNLAGEILGEMGFHVIDVDKLGHRALEDSHDALRERFGNEVITSEGKVDRRAVGSIVFKDRKALADLEAIVHPSMCRMVREEVENCRDRGVVINAAILFKMGLHSDCDGVIWIDAPLISRLKRGLKRDSLGFFRTIERIFAQRQLIPQHWKNHVDIYTIRNSGDRSVLKELISGGISYFDSKLRS